MLLFTVCLRKSIEIAWFAESGFIRQFDTKTQKTECIEFFATLCFFASCIFEYKLYYGDEIYKKRESKHQKPAKGMRKDHLKGLCASRRNFCRCFFYKKPTNSMKNRIQIGLPVSSALKRVMLQSKHRTAGVIQK